MARREWLAREPVVEVAPGGMGPEGGGEVVLRLLEVEVVVLVEHDGLRCEGGIRGDFADHPGDAMMRPSRSMQARRNEPSGAKAELCHGCSRE